MKLNSLKNKILVTVIGIILFFGSFATLVIFINTKNTLMEAQKNALTIAALQEVETLLQLFERSSDLVEYASEEQEIINYFKGEKVIQDEEILSSLKKFNIGDKYLSIYLLNTDGTVIVSTDESFVGNNVFFRDYFKSAMSGNPGVDVAIGVTSKELGYYFSRPVKENDEIIGVLTAKLNPEEIYSILDRKNNFGQLFSSAKFLLIDDAGVILYSHDEDMLMKSLGVLSKEEKNRIINTKRYDDIEISPLNYDLILNNLPKTRDSKFFSIKDSYHGGHESIVIAKVKQFPFYVMLETEEKDVARSAMISSLMIGVFVLLAALSAMLLIMLIASKFLKPLNQLTKMAKEISRGNYKEKINIKSNDEFEDLGKAFNKMAKKLHKSKIKTEQKIKERTEELNKMNKFMVNRELKMIELKEQIKKLKNKKNENKK